MSKVKHQVLVDRTVTQSLYIEVETDEGASMEEIRALAEDAACDHDFSNGTKSEPTYEAVDIVLATPTQRPRG